MRSIDALIGVCVTRDALVVGLPTWHLSRFREGSAVAGPSLFHLIAELRYVESRDPRGLFNYEFGMHPAVVVALHEAAQLPFPR